MGFNRGRSAIQELWSMATSADVYAHSNCKHLSDKLCNKLDSELFAEETFKQTLCLIIIIIQQPPALCWYHGLVTCNRYSNNQPIGRIQRLREMSCRDIFENESLGDFFLSSSQLKYEQNALTLCICYTYEVHGARRWRLFFFKTEQFVWLKKKKITQRQINQVRV